MTRTTIIFAAAFATLTGCAQDFDQVDSDGLTASGFAGIDRSLPIAPMNNDPAFPEDGGQTNSAWAPADLPAGTYWMTVIDVADLQGNAQMEVGSRQLSYVTTVDGVPMLQGMAPIMSNGEELSAQQVDVYTAPIPDGRCKIMTALHADGEQTGPDAFEMSVHFEDSVTGEDCYKLGYGDEKVEIAAFRATFTFIPPVVDDPKDEPDPNDEPNPGNG